MSSPFCPCSYQHLEWGRRYSEPLVVVPGQWPGLTRRASEPTFPHPVVVDWDQGWLGAHWGMELGLEAAGGSSWRSPSSLRESPGRAGGHGSEHGCQSSLHSSRLGHSVEGSFPFSLLLCCVLGAKTCSTCGAKGTWFPKGAVFISDKSLKLCLLIYERALSSVNLTSRRCCATRFSQSNLLLLTYLSLPTVSATGG